MKTLKSELLQMNQEISRKANNHFTEFNKTGYATEGKLQYVHHKSLKPDYLAANGLVELNGWGLLFPDEIEESGKWSDSVMRLDHLYQFKIAIYAETVEYIFFGIRRFDLFNWVTEESREVFAVDNAIEDGVNQTFGSYGECLQQAWIAANELARLGDVDIFASADILEEAIGQTSLAGLVRSAAKKHRHDVPDKVLSEAIARTHPELDETIPLEWRIALL
jgi:hypothetical protein